MRNKTRTTFNKNQISKAYIVCFDFYSLRSKYRPQDGDDYSDYAVDFMDTCLIVKDKIMCLFPNKVIDISQNTFLIRCDLDQNRLMEILVKEILSQFDYKRDGGAISQQIYISNVSKMTSMTFSKKRLELEYLQEKVNGLD